MSVVFVNVGVDVAVAARTKIEIGLFFGFGCKM